VVVLDVYFLQKIYAKQHVFCDDIKYLILIDDDLHINQFDMAVVIANALDNAIEGIQRSTGDIEKLISLDIHRASDYVSIIVENNASGPVYSDFPTSKLDKKNHGFGMSQMEAISKKYNGSFRPSFDSEKRRFLLKVILKNQKN